MSQPCAERQKFYRDNYEVVFERKLTGTREAPLGQGTLRQCRFCQGSSPSTVFRAVAHTIPSMIGNRTLFSLDECKNCNKKFGLLEDDFGKFTMPERAFACVEGYNNVPSLRMGDGNRLKVSSVLNRFEFFVMPDAKSVVASKDDKSVSVEVKLQPYRPLAVYKTLVKMAVAVAPPAEMPLLELSRQWLALDSLAADFLPKSVIPPFTIRYGLKERLKYPEVLLLRRKLGSVFPHTSLIVRFGISQYQIFPPCTSCSKIPRKTSLVLEHFMPPKITNDDQGLVRQHEVFDLASPTKTSRIWKGLIKMPSGNSIEHEWD